MRTGLPTTDREFCIGEELIFRCTLTERSYDWIVTSYLDRTSGNGRIEVGANETIGEFLLSASGTDFTRMSTAQITTFEGLVGQRNITCHETGNIYSVQTAMITVLGESNLY